jgi:hypothetical protein
MRKSRYPLEQVLALRVRTCQEAEVELARARGRVQDAQVALAAAEEAHKAHAEKRTLVVTPTAEQAFVSAQALAWSGAYAARLHGEAKKLSEGVKAARAAASAEARALRLAELTWHQAYAERETLNRHHERFQEAERKVAQRADELEAEDLWHPAHRPQART